MRSFIILVFLVVCVACREENASPTTPIDDDFDPTQATLLRSGMLMGVGHDVSGTASIYDQAGKKIVFLSPYMSQNGPDLKVYLSKDGDATDYINLGNLKSIIGNQSYEVPGNPDVSEYKFVIIWCQQFTVLFGVAETQL
jgi:hypothetical protein